MRPIAIDGKTQRGSARRTIGQSPLHMVSAWSVENHLTLGQVATHAKSNEITAIPELLKLLDLEGAVVTIDAMGCQKEIAAGIDQGGGKYMLAVKENQPHLFKDIQKAFDEALDQGEPGVDFTECHTEEVQGSRHETRTCCVIKKPSGIRNAGLWVISDRAESHSLGELGFGVLVSGRPGERGQACQGEDERDAQRDCHGTRGNAHREIPEPSDRLRQPPIPDVTPAFIMPAARSQTSGSRTDHEFLLFTDLFDQ